MIDSSSSSNVSSSSSGANNSGANNGVSSSSSGGKAAIDYVIEYVQKAVDLLTAMPASQKKMVVIGKLQSSLITLKEKDVVPIGSQAVTGSRIAAKLEGKPNLATVSSSRGGCGGCSRNRG